MRLFTIGFTKKSAERFFDILKYNNIQCLVDIRLNPEGQLAGFAKKGDLAYFLKQLIGCDYLYLSILAPSDELLKRYRVDHDWQQYHADFEILMDRRGIPEVLDRSLFEEKICCLMCSEATPDECHRRLVADRISRAWPNVQVTHL
jgi:uncharacterized protein (DUF488 family)